MSETTPSILEWTARVRFDKCELRTSFAVLIFVGEVPEDPQRWRSSPTYVGGHKAFVDGSDPTGPSYITEGFVHLNKAIAAQSGLNSFEPEGVVPFLKKNLSWRIQRVSATVLTASQGPNPSAQVDRSVIDPDMLKSLEVTVLATPVGMKPGEIFPKPIGEPAPYKECTAGRAGGCSEE